MEIIRIRTSSTPGELEAVIGETGASTTHRVHLDAETLQRLGRPGETPEAFVHRCVEFLLAREPKESILSSFDVEVISRYFPEFEDEIGASG